MKFFTRIGSCFPPGLLDISACYYGFPIALSYPHFLDAGEEVGKYVTGMEPNRTEHETYFFIQPVSFTSEKYFIEFFTIL